MTYESAAVFAQTSGLLYFIGIFLALIRIRITCHPHRHLLISTYFIHNLNFLISLNYHNRFKL